ncbi:hypothetical protein [Leeuwenhoekiella parthenopeia]|uniref:TonB family protein n=1 Tax=Leeuwenhoekiella parthenopeia TaxID=2890320 RepID=A0ABS8GNW9_9FLAO|nr:hypothetical protein [Leeuwenhoekiella parthenopeia]MCC4211679.1 hypothetical protein [Leeuwenhoekiella parthenopeia]
MKMTSQDKAMLITFSGAAFLFVVFLFLTVKPYDTSQVEEFIPIPIIQDEPKEEPTPQEVEEQKQLQSQQITNQAQSSNREVREANRYFSQQNQVNDALKTDSETLEPSEDTDGEDENFPDYRERIALLRQKRREEQSAGDSKTAEKISKVNTSSYRRSTVTYQLKDRNAVQIPNPVYTCDATGKVVINIEVNGSGGIIKAYFNKSASSTSNGCLVDQALEYAENAIFNKSDRATQLGSITFEFQG